MNQRDRLRQMLLDGDEDAADSLMLDARRSNDEQLAAFVRSRSRRYRWPGVQALAEHGVFVHLKTGLQLVECRWAAEAAAGSSFLIGRSLVEQGVFWRFVQVAPRWLPESRKASAFMLAPLFGWDSGRPRTEELSAAVTAVPWSAAHDFCDWAELELPTGAQWQAFCEQWPEAGLGSREWCEDAFVEGEAERVLAGPQPGQLNAEWPELVDPAIGFRVALSAPRECSLALERQYAMQLERLERENAHGSPPTSELPRLLGGRTP